MSVVSEYTHLIPTLQVYPRVYYFYKRYSDLLGKFERFKNKYENFFDDKEPKAGKNILQKGLAIKVIGRNDLRPDEYLTVGSDLYRVQPCKPRNEDTYIDYIIAVDPHKEKMKLRSSPSKSTFELPLDVSGLSFDDFCSSPGTTIVICSANVQELDDNALKEIQFLSTLLSEKKGIQQPDCVLFCRCSKLFTWSEKKAFRDKIAGLEIFDLVVIESTCGENISNFLEYKLADSFKALESILLLYKGIHSGNCPVKQQTLQDVVVHQIDNFVHHAREKVEGDEKTLKVEPLARAIRCALVQPLSEKFNVPVSLCNNILIANDFERVVVERISGGILELLENHKNGSEISCNEETDPKTERKKFVKISSDLQTDLEKIGRTLNMFTSPVKKMLLEISACMKKFKVSDDEQQLGNSKTARHGVSQIEENLRKDILSLEEVYGVGTIYGQLEVHVRDGKKIDCVRKKVHSLFRKNNTFIPLVIKALKSYPELFVDNQYEHGEVLVCSSGRGTLGGFLDGDDTHLYALTCAHVIGGKGVTDVLIDNEASGHPVLLAHSDPKMTVLPGNPNKPLIDLAALKVVDDMKRRCVKFLKDDDGMIRPGIISTETTSELLGNYVYKHGAVTQLTKGLVCSDDYHILNEEASTYILLIDNYDDENDVFAQKGDSGSMICSPDENEVYVVKANGLLSAGEFSLEDREMPLYFSFRLLDGLRKLTSQTGGVQFSFPTEHI